MADDPFAFAVTMAWDAFRICIGQPTKTHRPEEVLRWMLTMLRQRADRLTRDHAVATDPMIEGRGSILTNVETA